MKPWACIYNKYLVRNLTQFNTINNDWLTIISFSQILKGNYLKRKKKSDIDMQTILQL